MQKGQRLKIIWVQPKTWVNTLCLISIRGDDVEQGAGGRMAKGNQVRKIAKKLIWSFETKSSQQNSERTGCEVAGRANTLNNSALPMHFK